MPLHASCKRTFDDVAKLLLLRGAKASAVCGGGDTALHMVCDDSGLHETGGTVVCRESCAMLLLQRGADISAANRLA